MKNNMYALAQLTEDQRENLNRLASHIEEYVEEMMSEEVTTASVRIAQDHGTPLTEIDRYRDWMDGRKELDDELNERYSKFYAIARDEVITQTLLRLLADYITNEASVDHYDIYTRDGKNKFDPPTQAVQSVNDQDG